MAQTMTAARAPEKYYACIAVEQRTDQLKSEKLAYDYMLAESERTGSSGIVKKLEAAPVTTEDSVPRAYSIMLREAAMHMVGGGTMHSMRSVVTGIMLPSFASPQYTLIEIRSIQRQASHARARLRPLPR